MDITYDYYRIFYYVARYGGISQAANALMRAQPNISKTVKNLEAQLGCRLFLRTGKGVILTPEGEKLYRHLDIAFRHIAMGESEIMSAGNFDSGMITVATTEMAFYCSVLDALTAFGRDYPGVKVRVSNQNNSDALGMLKNGLADYAVLSGIQKPSSAFSYTKLLDFREVLCSKSGCVFNESFDISEIGNHTYIALDKSTFSYDVYKNYFNSLGIDREPDIEVATATQVLNAVRRGVGIGFVAEPMAREFIDKGEIEELKLKKAPKKRQIYLAEDKGRSPSAVAVRFKEYLCSPKSI